MEWVIDCKRLVVCDNEVDMRLIDDYIHTCSSCCSELVGDDDKLPEPTAEEETPNEGD